MRWGASVAVNTPDVGLVGRSLSMTQTLDPMSFFNSVNFLINEVVFSLN